MKRHISVGLAIMAVVAGVGWKLARRPGTSVGLDDIRLIQSSEHSHPGPSDTLAGVRIRLSPNDLGYAATVPAHKVPRIALTVD